QTLYKKIRVMLIATAHVANEISSSKTLEISVAQNQRYAKRIYAGLILTLCSFQRPKFVSLVLAT
ncbi:hypothetical protein HNQ80_003882, partial [Anaerosolibacter carboniphilus]